MRTFSKLVVICNCCFIITVICGYIEARRRTAGNYDALIPFPAIESSIIVLGYCLAILLNLIFNIIVLIFLFKRRVAAPKWIIWFNFLILLLQIYYLGLYKW